MLDEQEKELLSIAEQIEITTKTKGWEHMKHILQGMYIDILGGIDTNGDLIDGAISKPNADINELLGYRKALADFYNRAVKQPAQIKQDIMDKITAEEKAEKHTYTKIKNGGING